MLLDLKNYKLSKIVLKDLPVVLSHVELAIKQLTPYSTYKAVGRCLASLKDEREIIKGHIQAYKEIAKKRGKV